MLSTSVATTRLDHIRHNLDAVRARVGERTVLAAVKANAYGHGAIEVSRMIEATGAADWLGVATVPEGLQLRDAGVTLPILKLSHATEPDQVDAAVDAEIDLAVVDADTIDAVASAASRLGRTASVHLKVDTGMHRIGCPPQDAVPLARRADAAGLRLRGVFSHLPVSDTDGGRAFTGQQIALFASVTEAIADARGPVELRHLANSGGVLMHPDAWFDMVRPGIVVYGSLPDPTSDPTLDLRPGLEWTTQVSFVKQVAAGESVSYGRTWTAQADTWIATLPVGYGDGFSRRLSNAGAVLIGGERRPIVGRVCMDQLMVDLGPTTHVRPGDEAVLIGRQGDAEVSASEVAGHMGTIPYEVTCLVAGRVARRFT
ncbi:MAG: alanine racemase [Propioniciclava sp.]